MLPLIIGSPFWVHILILRFQWVICCFGYHLSSYRHGNYPAPDPTGRGGPARHDPRPHRSGQAGFDEEFFGGAVDPIRVIREGPTERSQSTGVLPRTPPFLFACGKWRFPFWIWIIIWINCVQQVHFTHFFCNHTSTLSIHFLLTVRVFGTQLQENCIAYDSPSSVSR